MNIYIYTWFTQGEANSCKVMGKSKSKMSLEKFLPSHPLNNGIRKHVVASYSDTTLRESYRTDLKYLKQLT